MLHGRFAVRTKKIERVLMQNQIIWKLSLLAVVRLVMLDLPKPHSGGNLMRWATIFSGNHIFFM